MLSRIHLRQAVTSRVPEAPGLQLTPTTPAGGIACAGCGRRYVLERFDRELRVCSWCGHHARIPARLRAEQLANAGSVNALNISLSDRDPLGFNDGTPYPAKVAEARRKTEIDETFYIARGEMGNHPVMFAVMDFGFLGGSLGSAAGELFLRGCDAAVAENRAFIAVCASGGARMQEGIASLAQMARCSAGVAAVSQAGLPYISILADPCFGGVTASFAVQADVIFAEPAARIGFAGGRVIEQAAHEKLPEGFQTAEFLLSHGMIDQVVDRRELRPVITRILDALDAKNG